MDVTNGPHSFRAAHKPWFIDFYDKGFVQARKSLKEYAGFLKRKNDGDFYETLNSDQIKQIDDMAELDVNNNEFCPNNFKYPS